MAKEKQAYLETEEFALNEALTQSAERIVFVLHGIQDDAAWAGALFGDTEPFGQKLVPHCLQYSEYEVVPFVLGLGRQTIRKRIIYNITQIYKEYGPDHPYHIICHSNGTKILAEIADQLPMRFHTVSFLGSIAKYDDLATVLDKCEFFCNFIGVYDPWVTLAEALRPDLFSQSGRIGFRSGARKLSEPSFNIGHNDALTPEFVRQHVVPFLLFQEKPQSHPAWVSKSVLSPTKLRYLIVIALIALVVGAFALPLSG